MAVGEPYLSRFLARVQKGPETLCWEWQAALGGPGYGMMGIGQKVYTAHRLAWRIWRGEIPKGMFVLHKCDNRKCCNPNHLFLGTQKDNMADCSRKGRIARLSGEEHPRAVLTEEQVAEIRKRHIPRLCPPGLLANEFGVSRRQVRNILSGENWTGVP